MIELPGWNDLISVNGFCYSSSMGESPKLNIPLKTSVAPTKGIAPYTFTRNSTATYIDNDGLVQTAGINVARFQNGRYLCEPAATNLSAYSEDFTHATWEAPNLTRSGGYTNPSGTNTATKLEIATSTENFKFLRRYFTALQTGTYVGSVFVKKGNHRYVGLRMFSTISNLNLIVFDFDTETLIINGLTDGNYGVIKLANGWYRLWHNKETILGTAYYASICLTDATGVEYISLPVGSHIYATGMQVESGSTPTSYIPTTTVSMGRVADALHYAVGDAITQGQGSLYCEFAVSLNNKNKLVLVLTNNTSDNNMYILIDTNNVLGIYLKNAGSFQLTSTSIPFSIVFTKILITYETNNIKIYTNGVLRVTDTICTIPTLSKLSIGCSYDNSNSFNGGIGNIKYLKEVLTPEEAIKITTL